MPSQSWTPDFNYRRDSVSDDDIVLDEDMVANVHIAPNCCSWKDVSERPVIVVSSPIELDSQSPLGLAT
jgi:hypothetical protein